jgi:hypothetical protein
MINIISYLRPPSTQPFMNEELVGEALGPVRERAVTHQDAVKVVACPSRCPVMTRTRAPLANVDQFVGGCAPPT